MPSGEREKAKTHCPHGHEYTTENTYVATKQDRGLIRHNRVCKECGRLRVQRKREDPAYLRRAADRMARWRERNPETNRVRWERAHAEKKQILDDARQGGCTRCSESDLACLDFHHRDNGATKDADIATMRRFGKKRLIAEITKCDVLCASCHRKHHRDERLIVKEEAA